MNYYTGNFPKKQSKNTGRGILRALPALLAAALLIGGVLFSFFFLLAAGGCAAEELSSLRSFSGTYAGVYECEEATLNGVDLLETYREITLELREDGTFCVIASPAGENALHADGVYAFDETGGILTLQGQYGGRKFSKRCVYENGAFAIVHTMPGVRFAARFRMLP